jgi:hypothetical protein
MTAATVTTVNAAMKIVETSPMHRLEALAWSARNGALIASAHTVRSP